MWEKKKEEKDKNPLHKEYGFFDNIQYILRKMIKEDKHFFILIPLVRQQCSIFGHLFQSL